jgi:hypothetical protein
MGAWSKAQREIYSRNQYGITRMDVLKMKDGGREWNYPGSSMAYPPEGSDWEASLSMNPSAGDVNTMNANRLIPQFTSFCLFGWQ